MSNDIYDYDQEEKSYDFWDIHRYYREPAEEYFDEEDYIEEQERKKVNSKCYKEIVSLIAGMNSNIKIKNAVIKKLFLGNLDYMIDVYSQREHLPAYYVNIAKQSDCLVILIRGFLKNEGNYILTSEIIEEINLFVKDIQLNTNFDIVYNRVQKIQQFLHYKVDKYNGDNSHLKLYPKTIKNLLSSARLHLNLQDIKSNNTDLLIHLVRESENASNEEKVSPSVMMSSTGDMYTSTKKIRDLRSLIDFGYYNVENKIYAITNLEIYTSLDNFKDNIIDIYCDKTHYKKEDKPAWAELLKNRWQE